MSRNPQTQDQDARPSGIPGVPALRWGAHISHFFRDEDDLLDVLVPFFRAGLEANERCIWVTCEPFGAELARQALAARVPDLELRIETGQIQILQHENWYLRSDGVSSRDVLGDWLRLEEEALEQGYDGLRISGNTLFLRREEWDSFTAYEHAVQEVFRGRCILAVCSYSLQRCTIDDVLDVLRHHDLALVRREGRWDLIRGATQLLVAVGNQLQPPARARSRSTHDARFYTAGEFPAEEVAAFLSEGLLDGGGALLVAQAPHAHAVRERLRMRGALDEQRFAVLDADVAMVNLDSQGIATEALRQLIAPAFEELPRPLRICGEIVDVLCKRGAGAQAVTLERCWNELLGESTCNLLCLYEVSSFEAPGDLLRQVVGAHSHSFPCSPERRQQIDEERARLLVRERQARLAALEANDRLLRLQRVTAALSEALSLDEVAHVTAQEVRAVLDAERAVVVLPTEDGAALRLHAQVGLDDILHRDAATIGLHEPLPVVHAWRTGEPFWMLDRSQVVAHFPELPPSLQAIICLPLHVASRRIGVLGMAFTSPRPLTSADRALLDDIARQAAVALDRARLFDQLRLERQRVEQASRAKDDFLAMLGHELRNPLAPMVTALHLMHLRGGDAFASERAILERQVQHMVRLVDDLLDISRITRGKVEIRPAPVKLGTVIAEAVELASPLLEERAQRLEIDVPTGLGVVADKHRLTQAIGNLLTNAARYTPDGGWIRLEGREEQDQLVLSVIDSGRGIAPELLPQVFDLFVQGRQALDRAQGGLGLGLSIVRALVELHGGTIRAYSDGVGQGSTFTIQLPIGARGLQAHKSMPPASVPARTGRLRRVLLVDDNRDAVDTLADALCALGYDARVAYDGPQALSLVNSFRPSLALLDIGLPGMDGYELAHHLTRRLEDAPPVLVALTGYGGSGDRERSRCAGFHAHLVKPITLEALEDLVHQLTT